MRILRTAVLAIMLFLGLPVANEASSGEPIRVAGIFALTGIASTHNEPAVKGALLAVKEVNARGGVLGRPLELVLLDNKSTSMGSKQAAEAATRLGPVAVLGPIWSSHSLAAAPVLQAAAIPMVTPLSTHPAVTEAGDYIFRTCFTDDYQGRIMARFAREQLKAATAATLVISDEEYSLGLGRVFAEEFQTQGGKVVLTGQYRAKALDFAPQLAQVASLAPDVVFVPGYGRDAALLIQQARNMGSRAVFLGGDAWSDLYAHGVGSLQGNFYSTFWHPEVHHPGGEAVRVAYLREYGPHGIDSADVFMTYDAMALVANAIERAGNTSSEAVRSALAATREFAGITGRISMGPRRNPMDRMAVVLRTGDSAPAFETVMGLVRTEGKP